MYQIINKDMPKLYTYEVEQKKQETFGNGRYPKRVRIPPLNHLRGEKAYYKFDENCNPYLAGVICERKSTISEYIKDAIKKQEEFSKEMRDYMKTMLISFSYAGSGNVSKI